MVMRLLLKPMESADVEIAFTCRTARRRDLTNMAEGLMDALVVAGILPDDCWQIVPRLTLSAERGLADKTTIFLRAQK